LAQMLSVKVHDMTLALPGIEKYETGQQIRRSIKSVRSNIVEGYGRRRYKMEFIRFLTYAMASNDETLDHLSVLYETKSLKDEAEYIKLNHDLELLGRKLNAFIKAVEKGHNDSSAVHEAPVDYSKTEDRSDTTLDLTSKIQNPVSSIQNLPQWQTLSSEQQYDNRWITVTEYQVINPAGKPGIYGKVHYKNKAIGIVPLDQHGNTWLVGQHRYTLNEWSWEIPEGGGPLHIDVLTSAKRELKEETGIEANTWQLLMRFHTSNSVTDEEGFIFLATDLQFGDNQLEESEADLQVMKLPFTEAFKMVMEGKITDSMSVAGILKAAILLNKIES